MIAKTVRTAYRRSASLPLYRLNPVARWAAWRTRHRRSWCWGSPAGHREGSPSPQSLRPPSRSPASAYPPSHSGKLKKIIIQKHDQYHVRCCAENFSDSRECYGENNNIKKIYWHIQNTICWFLRRVLPWHVESPHTWLLRSASDHLLYLCPSSASWASCRHPCLLPFFS